MADQGLWSDFRAGDEMEYLDSDDLKRKNWPAGRGNMIAGLKTKATKKTGQGCVGIARPGGGWRGADHGHHEEAGEPKWQGRGA